MSVKNPGIRSIMNVFEWVTEDEIKKLILSSSSKSCNLNPAHTSGLKSCLDILITPNTDIINILRKLSKKLMWDHYLKTPLSKNELKNYKPVSNLSFISKKIVVNWLQAHIKHNHLSNPLNPLTGNIILQNQLYWKYITISSLVFTRVRLQLWPCLTCRPFSTPLPMLH